MLYALYESCEVWRIFVVAANIYIFNESVIRDMTDRYGEFCYQEWHTHNG